MAKCVTSSSIICTEGACDLLSAHKRGFPNEAMNPQAENTSEIRGAQWTEVRAPTVLAQTHPKTSSVANVRRNFYMGACTGISFFCSFPSVSSAAMRRSAEKGKA